jgi:hypothetical protein
VDRTPLPRAGELEVAAGGYGDDDYESASLQGLTLLGVDVLASLILL